MILRFLFPVNITCSLAFPGTLLPLKVQPMAWRWNPFISQLCMRVLQQKSVSAIVLQHLSLHYNNLSGGGGGWKMNHFLWHHFITLFHSEKHQRFRSREEKWRQKNNCLMKPPAEGGVLPHGQSAFVHTPRSWPQKLLNHRKIEAASLLCWGNSYW